MTYLEVLTSAAYRFPIREPSTIVDAGANIGLASLWFAVQFPRARIIALEPQEDNFSLLVRNVAPYPNVVPVQAALWSHGGKLAIDNPNHGGAWAFRTSEPGPTGSHLPLVDSVTIPDILDMFQLKRIGLLKVDIEGSELDIFLPKPAWLTFVDTIAIELHDRLSPWVLSVLL